LSAAFVSLLSLIDAGARWRQSVSVSDYKRNKNFTLNSTRSCRFSSFLVNSL